MVQLRWTSNPHVHEVVQRKRKQYCHNKSLIQMRFYNIHSVDSSIQNDRRSIVLTPSFTVTVF